MSYNKIRGTFNYMNLQEKKNQEPVAVPRAFGQQYTTMGTQIICVKSTKQGFVKAWPSAKNTF